MKKNLIFIFIIVLSSAFLLCSFSNDQNSDLVLLQNGLPSQQSSEPHIPSSLKNLTNVFQDLPNSDLFQSGYLNDIIKKIASDSSIYDLIGFSIGMVVYGIFIYHFYRFLSKRDLFSFKLEQRIAGGKFTSTGKKISAAPRIIAFISMNFFIFPFVVFLWFLGYSSIMFLLVHQLPTATIFLVSSALIIAIRISAYYNEDLSRDLAKLLPFTLLGIFLYNPQFYSFNEIVPRLEEIPHFITQIASFIVVAMMVEITLSILYLIKVRFFHKKEKSKKVDDSETAI
jgi:hypothetical protein